ncbi:hypothetical protein [Litoreibacter albidus]|uniref:Uncharacterized protein n=1 Tax=Litoreibacter albidus TaxID=670155 RepID=A0A1H3DFH5_9RHOB|nr:hypothetical protein [Litoreibacter albidus]SDX65121.1 hypothetical protein SAMN04488001_0100 [Litoreibacter albidus]
MKLKMNNGSEPVLACPHVLRNLPETGFFCRTQDGLVAACCESCDALETGDGLGLVHLTHFSKHAELPEVAFSLPVNACIKCNDDKWNLDYFEDDTTPEEGEFRLAAVNDPIRHWTDKKEVQFFVLSESLPVLVTLDEGIRVLPVWSVGQYIPHDFSRKLDGREIHRKCALGEVQMMAAVAGVSFLAIDFLTASFDVGLIAQPLTCPV